MRLCMAIVALFFSMSLPAEAVTITVPVPQSLANILDSPWDEGPTSSTVLVDFGQQFASIDRITIETNAMGATGNGLDSQGQFVVFPPVFLLTISGQTIDTGAFVGSEVRVTTFESTSFDLSEFLDGSGDITFALADVDIDRSNPSLWSPAELIIEDASNIFSPSTVTIEGTLVPEPSTALLVASGLALLTRQRRSQGCR